LVIFLIEMAVVSRLVAKFNSYYAERPSMFHPFGVLIKASNGHSVLTMMITNAVLGGIADTVAQSITAIRLSALRKPGGITKDDTFAIEIHELDRKNPLNEQDLIPDSRLLPPPFDFERLTRFMAYGFGMAPVQFTWFKFLSRAFPITKSAGLGPALKMVAFDQLVFAPVGECHIPLRCIGTLTMYYRYRHILHSYDDCRGRWTTSSIAQTARHVPANPESELDGLALGSDHQLPTYANPVSAGQSTSSSSTKIILLISSSAFRLYRRYCLDGIPLPFQRCRGCYGSSVGSSISQHPIIVSMDCGDHRMGIVGRYINIKDRRNQALVRKWHSHCMASHEWMTPIGI
jgi:hypothetical protein